MRGEDSSQRQTVQTLLRFAVEPHCCQRGQNDRDDHNANGVENGVSNRLTEVRVGEQVGEILKTDEIALLAQQTAVIQARLNLPEDRINGEDTQQNDCRSNQHIALEPTEQCMHRISLLIGSRLLCHAVTPFQRRDSLAMMASLISMRLP